MNVGKQFSLNLSAAVGAAKMRTHAVVRKIVFDVGVELVERSPVGDPVLWKHPAPKGYVGGHFRANWQYQEGSPRTDIVDGVDPEGGSTISRIMGNIQWDAAGKIHYYSNNLPYAERLEFEGWSSQAPAGIVGITVTRFEPIVATAVQELAR